MNSEPIDLRPLLTVLIPLAAAGVGYAVWAIKRAKRKALERDLDAATERAMAAEQTESTADDETARAIKERLERELHDLDNKE